MVYDGHSLSGQVTWDYQPQVKEDIFFNVQSALASEKVDVTNNFDHEFDADWAIKQSWDSSKQEWKMVLNEKQGLNRSFEQAWLFASGEWSQSIKKDGGLLWSDSFSTKGTKYDVKNPTTVNVKPSEREQMSQLQNIPANAASVSYGDVFWSEDMGRFDIQAVNGWTTKYNLQGRG